MDDGPCGNPHEKRRAKLLAEFGKAKPGTIIEVDICLKCVVRAKARDLGIKDAGWWIIPAGLIEPLDET